MRVHFTFAAADGRAITINVHLAAYRGFTADQAAHDLVISALDALRVPFVKLANYGASCG